MHNGRIWFESTGVPGEGSTFSFTLPAYQIGESTNPRLSDPARDKITNEQMRKEQN
jgi:hypothetical protein